MPDIEPMRTGELDSFSDVWPFYLNDHGKTATRVLHAIGTLLGLALFVFLLAIGKWWLFPLALIPGYALAWIAHYFIERNRPATFTHPLWSFMGDWKML